MLLGSNPQSQTAESQETLIVQLLGQQRYAEAYLLLKQEPVDGPAKQFNLALCYYQLQNYTETIICLDKAMAAMPPVKIKPNHQHESVYQALYQQQSQTDNYKQPVSQLYIRLFSEVMHDAIIRLKTDCWLALQQYAKVIDTSAPVVHKNYHNITRAVITAQKALSA